MIDALLISIRFHDGRYHGSGEWPPSPARLFQALVAGAARGEVLSRQAEEAFEWLESLDAPAIVAPRVYAGQSFTNYVPNNDLDAVGGDPSRIGKIRAGKIIRPRTFDRAVALVYAWTFAQDAEAVRHAGEISAIADNLYQLGRGVDMAWATAEIVDDQEAEARLRAHGGIRFRPGEPGDGAAHACPCPGSLQSLKTRFTAMRGRFKTVGLGKKVERTFVQPPRSKFGRVCYNSPSTFLLFEIMKAGAFAPQPLDCTVALTEKIRNLAARRLQSSSWRQNDPKRENRIESVFVGRDAKEADKARRIRITPLPSIGHTQAERSMRRVLVTVPPDCCIDADDVAWAFAGLALDFDPVTGEVADDSAELVLGRRSRDACALRRRKSRAGASVAHCHAGSLAERRATANRSFPNPPGLARRR